MAAGDVGQVLCRQGRIAQHAHASTQRPGRLLWWCEGAMALVGARFDYPITRGSARYLLGSRGEVGASPRIERAPVLVSYSVGGQLQQKTHYPEVAGMSSNPSPAATTSTSSPAATPSTSSPAATPSTIPRRSGRVYLPQGRAVTRAYAVKLDKKCIYRWAEMLYDEFDPGEREQMTPEEFRHELEGMEDFAVDYMISKVYRQFPNLPSLRRASLYVRCPRKSWLFVFKDNSSHEALHAHLDLADVKGVKEFIGVKKQGAKWYHMKYEDEQRSRVY
ncbi:hypothetical protein C8Q74DRAFT_1439741 [Fomes fomentarius]|nr:hypothetical protein C8Q74DRAFT_1439741 [Fomes fomentarius]